MYRFLLTPRWIGGHLFAVAAVVACLWLGTWQLGRFEDRVQTHHDTGRAASASSAVPLTRALGTPAQVRTDTVGRTVTATGHYDPSHQLLVPERTLDGRQGYYVLTPLLTADGHAVAVVRGWHPGEPSAAAPPAPAPTGRLTVTGRLQASETSDTDGAVEGGLPAGQLGMISPATLVNVLPYPVYDGWVAADRAPAGLTAVPTVQPEGGGGLTLRAFQNLGYTLEWFVFAGFVLFMWIRLLRRETEAARDRALGLLPDQAGSEPKPPAPADPVGGATT